MRGQGGREEEKREGNKVSSKGERGADGEYRSKGCWEW